MLDTIGSPPAADHASRRSIASLTGHPQPTYRQDADSRSVASGDVYGGDGTGRYFTTISRSNA